MAVFLYRYLGDVDSASNTNVSASSTAATGSKTPAPASQPSLDASQSGTGSAKRVEDPIIAPVVSGIVRKEGTGEAITEAVVVLFTGDKRGAKPQMVDASSGQFRYEDVPLRAGITYSLQSKAPGLCGEESFTSESIDAKQTINRDIILKPCQYQAPVQQPAKSEEPGLTRISDGLGGILGPLNSMKVWIQILATTWILTIIVLLVATLIFMIFVRSQLAEARARIEDLYDWKSKLGPEGPKQDGYKISTVLDIPTDFSQTLKDLVAALKKRGPVVPRTSVQSDDEGERRDETPQRAAAAAPISAPISASISTLDYQPHSYGWSSPDPANWYRDLLQGEITNPLPLFVEINDALSEMDALVTNRRICFDERPHGSFVVLRESDSSGWIFPSPGSTVIADHHRVFENVDQKNFEQQQSNMPRKSVIFQEGCWQLVL